MISVKRIRKLIMVLMISVILVRVQADHDFAPTAASFCRSSLPARVPYFSELDHQIVPAGPLGICLAHRLKGCERLLKMGPIAELAHEFCIGDGILHCLKHIKEADDPSVPIFIRKYLWNIIIDDVQCFFSHSLDIYEIDRAPREEDKEDDSDLSRVTLAHGKKVYTDYSVIGIPGDGRCLFRSVAHGACLQSGKPAPCESLQRELADELRARVADEFIKRRDETEWFVEGDFDTYVSHMREPHVWGGEPELFIASHVLQMPITVYMYDEDAGGLISIAEYGQEYGKENPIRVLYHGFGHYDALQIPEKKGGDCIRDFSSFILNRQKSRDLCLIIPSKIVPYIIPSSM